MLDRDEQEEVGSGAAEEEEVVRDLHKNISGKMQQVKPSNLQGHSHQDASRCPDFIQLLNEALKLSEETLRIASGVTEDGEVASGLMEDEDQMQEATLFQKWEKKMEEADNLGRQLFYRKELRCPEIIRLLSEDLKFADATMEAYVSHFRPLPCLDKDFRRFLSVFWPEDEPELQDLLVKHFTRHFLTCTEVSLEFQTVMYYLCWSMIILNADLNGGHKGRKMTREEFLANLDGATDFQLSLKVMREVYKSIKTQPLTAFTVRSRCQAANPEDSGSNSSFGTEDNSTTTVYKKGHLICKRVLDENGRKTNVGQRSWKPFSAVLKGMVLHLQQDTDNKHAIRLHHALAYPMNHRKRPHVLSLRTADSRLFYFQAESEVEQASWLAVVNRIAARYSAPPLTSASHDFTACCPQVLPSFPTTRTLEQQLESHKDQIKRDSVQEVEELQRYVTYVRALQELVAEKTSATQRKG